ncbi:type II toxin-antitoxin system VapC family toxin [Dyadobacter sp. CY356]|uniref:type II toxin-antitoxin system VapC family toxin n=1 Tax=Dyadobacter sp. CY356 TaxID=2906442 RepID=UPI001F41A856|nr:type II toxin-antitoxin system VapC family toxin [Dyadobacter sp. CY356]MCF0055836.1 type II toxin-antitoxin system VapC family toxin [Dyadobacter sp. CY356]
MKYLIDTHTFLWFNEGSGQLSNKAKDLIENPDNLIYLSIASLWEVSIKTAMKKLEIFKPYQMLIHDIMAAGMEVLPITFENTVRQNILPGYHKDPFDRIIVSQALVEGLFLISRDEILDDYFLDYDIVRVW